MIMLMRGESLVKDFSKWNNNYIEGLGIYVWSDNSNGIKEFKRSKKGLINTILKFIAMKPKI